MMGMVMVVSEYGLKGEMTLLGTYGHPVDAARSSKLRVC